MNKANASSKFNEVKGKIKEEVGHITGNAQMEVEGMGSQIKSKIQGVVADAKERAKKVADSVLNKSENRNKNG